ncbi:MAG TPA: hypothetical protein PLK52_08760 [Usitatibacteraceae bacterium]|jgi:uncharacterized low-complexity protein|nr:hypothetical protein [Usitatibacteraceae bacterium]HRA23637.1 hypothetical protein [Usitatibacteraceae bacterium]
MRTTRLLAAALVAAIAGAPALARAAGTEMLDLDPLLAAKVAKEKAKAGASGAAKGRTQGADKTVAAGKGECGVNIGNVDSGKAPGRVATPRDNTVVITGPVINLGKCK